ncbi:MAG TPA: MFS transporter [Rhizomicrobium sp.]|nr:MFS transporter [Rhizomicrobium sp.]
MAAELTDAPRKRHVFAIVAGNALEFYDFLTFSYFSIYIGQTFFPSHDPMLSLLASLATFGVGFATRPIGAVVIGNWADRNGRKPATIFCFALMGITIVALVLTPSYASIGVAAPIIVVTLRLVQGFALGGELGPTTALLIEAAPANRRGFYGALQGASQFSATFFAGLIGFVLTSTLAPDMFAAYGWRVAMLIGVLVVPIGLFLMRDMPDTVHVPAPGEPDRAALLKSNARVMLIGIALLGSATVGVYSLLFIPTYAMQILHMPAHSTFGATMLVGLAGALLGPIGGIVSDRYGRKPVMIGFALMTLILIVPGFMLLDHFRTATALLAVAFVLAAGHTIGSGVLIMAVPEAMPPAVRSGATSVVYALAIAVFGGSAQFIVAWLIKHTGDNLAPAYYWAVAAVIGLIAMTLFPESAPAVLRRRRGA